MIYLFRTIYASSCIRYASYGIKKFYLSLQCLWIFSFIDYEPPTYENYRYPLWAETLGWIFTGMTLISVPTFAVYVVFNSEGSSFLKVRP